MSIAMSAMRHSGPTPSSRRRPTSSTTTTASSSARYRDPLGLPTGQRRIVPSSNDSVASRQTTTTTTTNNNPHGSTTDDDASTVATTTTRSQRPRRPLCFQCNKIIDVDLATEVERLKQRLAEKEDLILRLRRKISDQEHTINEELADAKSMLGLYQKHKEQGAKKKNGINGKNGNNVRNAAATERVMTDRRQQNKPKAVQKQQTIVTSNATKASRSVTSDDSMETQVIAHHLTHPGNRPPSDRPPVPILPMDNDGRDDVDNNYDHDDEDDEGEGDDQRTVVRKTSMSSTTTTPSLSDMSRRSNRIRGMADNDEMSFQPRVVARQISQHQLSTTPENYSSSHTDGDHDDEHASTTISVTDSQRATPLVSNNNGNNKSMPHHHHQQQQQQQHRRIMRRSVGRERAMPRESELDNGSVSDESSAASSVHQYSRVSGVSGRSAIPAPPPRRLETIRDEMAAPPQQQQQQSEDDTGSTASSSNLRQVVDYELIDPYGEKGAYTGTLCLRSNAPQGFGIMTYTDPARTYEGVWEQGRWHGQGKLTHHDIGDVYEGDFVNDERHGTGTYQQESSGRLYIGSFRHNKLHGEGTLSCHAFQYNGEFANGHQHGAGQIYFSNGGSYQGEFQEDMFWGRGEQSYADGRFYTGDFIQNKRNGQGIEYNADGNIEYEGRWINDEPLVQRGN